MLSRIVKFFTTERTTDPQKCVACGKTIIGNPWRNLFHESLCERCFCSNEVNIDHGNPSLLSK